MSLYFVISLYNFLLLLFACLQFLISFGRLLIQFSSVRFNSVHCADWQTWQTKTETERQRDSEKRVSRGGKSQIVEERPNTLIFIEMKGGGGSWKVFGFSFANLQALEIGFIQVQLITPRAHGTFSQKQSSTSNMYGVLIMSAYALIQSSSTHQRQRQRQRRRKFFNF